MTVCDKFPKIERFLLVVLKFCLNCKIDIHQLWQKFKGGNGCRKVRKNFVLRFDSVFLRPLKNISHKVCLYSWFSLFRKNKLFRALVKFH